MTERVKKVRVGVVALASCLLLFGCGPVQPGSAAVIGETRIPMTQVDDALDAYCQIYLIDAASSGVTDLEAAPIRTQVLSDLVLAEVAEQVALREGLSLPQQTITTADRTQLAQVLPEHVDEIVAIIERGRRTESVKRQLGAAIALSAAAELDPEPLEEELVAAGRQVLLAELDQLDVQIDPRFGLDENLQWITGSGSLSVSASTAEPDLATLSDAVKCSR